jgi:hypothetical protein
MVLYQQYILSTQWADGLLQNTWDRYENAADTENIGTPVQRSRHKGATYWAFKLKSLGAANKI